MSCRSRWMSLVTQAFLGLVVLGALAFGLILPAIHAQGDIRSEIGSLLTNIEQEQSRLPLLTSVADRLRQVRSQIEATKRLLLSQVSRNDVSHDIREAIRRLGLILVGETPWESGKGAIEGSTASFRRLNVAGRFVSVGRLLEFLESRPYLLEVEEFGLQRIDQGPDEVEARIRVRLVRVAIGEGRNR